MVGARGEMIVLKESSFGCLWALHIFCFGVFWQAGIA
jgi:hypothetical protein